MPATFCGRSYPKRTLRAPFSLLYRLDMIGLNMIVPGSVHIPAVCLPIYCAALTIFELLS